MKLPVFLRQWAVFAMRGSTHRADRMQILAAIIIPTVGISAILPILTQIAKKYGYPMADVTLENYPYFLGYALLIWIVLRALVGPYFIWRDESDRADILETRLAEPEFIERKWLAKHIAKRKAKLAQCAAQMVSIANMAHVWTTFDPTEPGSMVGLKEDLKSFSNAEGALRAGIEELSYLPYIRELGLDLHNACMRLIDSYKNHEDARPAKSDTHRLRGEFIRALHMR